MLSSVLYSTLLIVLLSELSDAFSRPSAHSSLTGSRVLRYDGVRSSSSVVVPSRTFVVRALLSSQDVVFLDESSGKDDDEEQENRSTAQNLLKTKSSRWARLDPNIKAKMIKAGQQRAIANKKKREPIEDKKRSAYFNLMIDCASFLITHPFCFCFPGLLMFVKKKQQEKKRDGRVARPLSFEERTPLSALINGMEMSGLVISLTKFGAYIDVGTEVDGLLHVSQLSNSVFIEHPREMLTAGEEVIVRVGSVNADKKKLHLTMLPPDVIKAAENDKNDTTDRIKLDEIMVDDELWGELRRVTDYGGYVEVGAVVDGWLHYMDHSAWERGAHPSEFMNVGDRVRVWVADIDQERQRIKLTANRPAHLPGPKRVFN
jgi:predicted RNA-binding protein with RPS1 domain